MSAPKPSDEYLYVNGVCAADGRYALSPPSAREVAEVARAGLIASDEASVLADKDLRAQPRAGPLYDAPRDLALSGWGVVFAPGLDEVKSRLAPLLERRRVVVAEHEAKHYHEFVWPLAGVPDTALDFVLHYGGQLGTSDPARIPFYLLLVGSPEVLCFEFQYLLDIGYAVGRLWFERDGGRPDLEAFGRYATSVVDAEESGVARTPSAAFFGVRHEGDPATIQSADLLVRPLRNALGDDPRSRGWSLPLFEGDAADKERAHRVFGGEDAPAILFVAAHGLEVHRGDPSQARLQGALVCADWAGPKLLGNRPVPSEVCFSAADVRSSANLRGQVVYLFACHGAGTPQLDDFPHPKLAVRRQIADRPFLSRLPQALLAHQEGGVLAVIGHVERAWSCSFHWQERSQGFIATYQNMMARLLRGERVGWAVDEHNVRCARVAMELTEHQRKARFGYVADPKELAYLWTAYHDARNVVVLGDPAVQVCTGGPAGEPAATRSAPLGSLLT